MPEARLELLRRLYEHGSWADGRVAQALEGARAAEAASMFSHVLGAEEIWLARLQEREPRLPVWPELSPTECAHQAERLGAAYHELLAGLDEAALDAECRYTTSDGRDFATPVHDILVHVALHGAYHRGQVATLLRQAGDAAQPTDFIHFARGGAAAKRQDAAPRGDDLQVVHPCFAARDYAEALAFYRDQLGFEVVWEWGSPPFRAGVRRGAVELQLIHDPVNGPTEPSQVYVHMQGIDGYYAACRENGANVTRPLETRPWGMRDFRVVDPSGNALGFGEPVQDGR